MISEDVDTIRRLLGDAPERVLFEQAIARGRGGANNPEGLGGRAGKTSDTVDTNVNPDNIRVDKPAERDRTKEPPAGTSVSYAIRRLARERPDLLEKVKAGELSAHRAMLDAGFRRMPSPLDLAKKAFSRLAEEDRAAFDIWRESAQPNHEK